LKSFAFATSSPQILQILSAENLQRKTSPITSFKLVIYSALQLESIFDAILNFTRRPHGEIIKKLEISQFDAEIPTCVPEPVRESTLIAILHNCPNLEGFFVRQMDSFK